MKVFNVLALFFFVFPLHAQQISGTWGDNNFSINITRNSNVTTWAINDTEFLTITKSNQTDYFLDQFIHNSHSQIIFQQKDNVYSFNGNLDKKEVDLKVTRTNLNVLFCEGIFQNHRPSLKFVLPSKDRMGEATGFFRNNLADMRVYKAEGNTIFEGYLNGYYIDLKATLLNDKTITLSGNYLSKTIALNMTSADDFNDVMEYLFLGMPIPDIDFFNFNLL